MNPALPDLKPAGHASCYLAALFPSPGMWRPRSGEGTHNINKGGLGRTRWGHPHDPGAPWEVAMDSNLTAQPQGSAHGTVHGEGLSPTPSTGEGVRQAYLLSAMNPQTSHFTSLDPLSHLEYEAIKYSCLHGIFSLFLLNFSWLSNNRCTDSTESSYPPFNQLLLLCTSSTTMAHLSK